MKLPPYFLSPSERLVVLIEELNAILKRSPPSILHHRLNIPKIFMERSFYGTYVAVYDLFFVTKFFIFISVIESANLQVQRHFISLPLSISFTIFVINRYIPMKAQSAFSARLRLLCYRKAFETTRRSLSSSKYFLFQSLQ